MTEQQHSEHHHPHEYRLIVDNRQHEWPMEFITGDEIKKLANVDPATYSVWEVVPGPGEDIEIGDHQKVDLKGHEKKFITGKKHSTEG
jgi:Multiubiquitin